MYKGTTENTICMLSVVVMKYDLMHEDINPVLVYNTIMALQQ